MDPIFIIKRPVITEKSTRLSREENKYTFVVDRRARKGQIKEAVEQLFGVKVVSVRTIVVPGKMRRRGKRRLLQKSSGFKKAVVEIKKGERIEGFEIGG